MSVKYIRLVNGDELFAQVTSTDEHLVYLKNPLVAVDLETPDGRGTISLAPYLPYTDESDNECSIQLPHIVTCSGIADEVARHYWLSLYFCNEVTQNQLMKISAVNDLMHDAMIEDEVGGTQDMVSTSVH